MWAEFTIGYSYAEYNTLDLYIRMMNNLTPVPPPHTEAWCVLNSFVPVAYRWRRSPEYWWMCKDLVSYGQKWVVDEHVYERTGVMLPADVVADMPAVENGNQGLPSPRTMIANAMRLQRMAEQYAREHGAQLRRRSML